MADNTNALSHKIDTVRMNEVSDKVNNLSKEVIDMADQIANDVCADLDDYMRGIDEILTNQELPVTDYQLDDFVLNLSSLLYLVSDAQENLGIKEDVSRAIQREVYNRVREKAQGTVADKDTAAELQCQEESITTIVYARAYKKVKLRVEAAAEMVNSVKKVMTRRIAEYEMSQGDGGRIGGGTHE